jgi:hypothetical protein
MKRNNNQDVPVFFFNSSEEDREAFRFIVDSGIPCDFSAAADEPTPLLLVGYQRFVGLEEIKNYVSEHSQRGGFQAT